MKTYCRGLVIDREFVHAAYLDWLGKEAGRKNAWRVPGEHGSADALIDEIAAEIRGRSLDFRPIRRYRAFDSGKQRVLGIESVKQQVVDYVAIRCMSEALDKRVGYWQVSAVKGKGQTFAAKAIRKWARRYRYHVHADIRKCYASTSHGVVLRFCRRRFACDDFIYVVESILSTYTNGGLELGSAFSLRIMQLLLSDAYHMVEEMHGVRRGKRRALVGAQLWYMDDIYMFGDRKADLRAAVRAVGRYLSGELGLSLKPWKVCRSDSEPVDAVGFTVRPERTTLRPRLFIRLRRAYRRFGRRGGIRAARRVASYWGWLEHSDSQGVVSRLGLGAIKQGAALAVSGRGAA